MQFADKTIKKKCQEQHLHAATTGSNTSAEYAIHSSFSEPLKTGFQNLRFAKKAQKETYAYNRSHEKACLEDSGPFLARVFFVLLQGPKKTRAVSGSRQSIITKCHELHLLAAYHPQKQFS